jgi:hypothetical protein
MTREKEGKDLYSINAKAGHSRRHLCEGYYEMLFFLWIGLIVWLTFSNCVCRGLNYCLPSQTTGEAQPLVISFAQSMNDGITRTTALLFVIESNILLYTILTRSIGARICFVTQ